MRKHNFVIGEYYHIYNRGVDKRKTVLDQYDLYRFFKSMQEFNAIEPIGSIYELSFLKQKFGTPTTKSKLVSIIAYCINPNHFHFLITRRELINPIIHVVLKRLNLFGYAE